MVRSLRTVVTIRLSHREQSRLESIDVRGVLGLLLVDGSLVKYRTPTGGYVQLTLTAGVTESAFLEEKVAEFREFVPTKAEIVPYRTPPRASGKTTEILRFRVSTNKLRPVYNLLYPSGEREITSTALELLGGQALAWAWAEGARFHADGRADMARVGSYLSEAERMRQWVERLTGAKSEVVTERTRPRLRFSQDDAQKLCDAIAGYAPASRRHLFTRESVNVCGVCRPDPELLPGDRVHSLEGSPQAAMA